MKSIVRVGIAAVIGAALGYCMSGCGGAAGGGALAGISPPSGDGGTTFPQDDAAPTPTPTPQDSGADAAEGNVATDSPATDAAGATVADAMVDVVQDSGTDSGQYVDAGQPDPCIDWRASYIDASPDAAAYCSCGTGQCVPLQRCSSNGPRCTGTIQLGNLTETFQGRTGDCDTSNGPVEAQDVEADATYFYEVTFCDPSHCCE